MVRRARRGALLRRNGYRVYIRKAGYEPVFRLGGYR
jgi:hypothetical protein